MTARRLRTAVVLAISAVFLLAWAFPIIWSVLNSFKTDSDVLAYPPKLIFSPTLGAYRDVLFGSGSILPNLVSSMIISVGTTIVTMLMAVPAAYALARLRFRGKKFAGFYVLTTQMLPPVGIIIPYFLVLRNIGWIDTYQGIILIYLSFSLPFAIWLLVSYFEDIPFEMEEAAYLDGASRLRTLWRIVIPQVRGGIAVTIVFVFLNAWNEFLFAVVLSGNTVRPVTVAMFNFVSVLFLDLWDWAWFRVGSARKLGVIVGVPRDKLTFIDCPVTFMDVFRGSEGVVAGFWVRFIDRKGSNLLWFKFGMRGDNR